LSGNIRHRLSHGKKFRPGFSEGYRNNPKAEKHFKIRGFFLLTNYFFLSMGRITQDKAKPVVKLGRKATGHYDTLLAAEVIHFL